MHWGWSSGYRFACLEGKSGANLAQIFEVHALEDSNYFHTTVMTAGVADGNDIVIDLDADIARALENIDVSSGPTNHGGGGISHIMLENFRDYVFSPASPITASEEQLNQADFGLFPNPSNGAASFRIDPRFAKGAEVFVYDGMGRLLQSQEVASNGLGEVQAPANGIYLVCVQKEGKTVVARRWVVNQ
jgi:hypothetical protein